MNDLLIAIVGDITSTRQLVPILNDPQEAKDAAKQIGAELAKAGARLLVYGGPFLESDVISGYVAAKPIQDHCIELRYSTQNVPPPFAEEKTNTKLFDRRPENSADWEVAFYRAIMLADGIILMGGGNATKISGLVAIGNKMPIIALSKFGGGACKVWESLSAGEDLPTRSEIEMMAKWDSKLLSNA